MRKKLFVGDLADANADEFLLENKGFPLDMLVIRPDGNLKKEDAQEINDFLEHSPCSRSCRAVVVQNFEIGNAAFYDCLLKSVEDADCDMVLCAKSISGIPKTMLSRLIVTETAKLSPEKMKDMAINNGLTYSLSLYALSGGSWSAYNALQGIDLSAQISGIDAALRGDHKSLFVSMGLLPDRQSLFETGKQYIPFLLNYCDYILSSHVTAKNAEVILSIARANAVFRQKMRQNAGKNDFLTWVRSYLRGGVFCE